MAHKVVWTPTALKRFHEISDYISEDSEAYAADVITEILEAVDRLTTFPRLVRRVPKWDHDELREILVFKWRIVYRIFAHHTAVAKIIHGAQRWGG